MEITPELLLQAYRIGVFPMGERRESIEPIGHLGLALSEERNRDADGVEAGEIRDIGAPGRRVHILVVGADEERQIAEEVCSVHH